MSIQVNQFVWKPGENDAEYIRLLKRANDEAHSIMLRATAKLAKMAKTHAKVVHGHWVGLDYDGYADGNPVYDVWECSQCGYEINREDTPNYCENCGAKMDGDCNG